MEADVKDKKGMAALLVAKMPKKEAEGGGEDGYDGKMACAEDMMRAVSSNDAAGFMKALEAYLDHRH